VLIISYLYLQILHSAQESDLHIFAVIEHFYIKDKRGGLWFYQIVLILLHRFNGALK